jgi:hypothetical protein
MLLKFYLILITMMYVKSTMLSLVILIIFVC